MKETKGFFASNIANAVTRDINEANLNRFKNMIKCRRFPQSVDKYKTDICGEYSDR